MPKDLCGNCGKRRPLKTVRVTYAKETRVLDMCRPCNQALKFAVQHQGEAKT